MTDTSAEPMLALPSAGGAPTPNLVRTGTFLLISSATMLFGGLLAAYLHLRRTVAPWPPEDVKIDQYLGNVLVMTLLLGIVTVEWACWALRRDERRQAVAGLGVTIGIGLAYLNLMSYSAGSVDFDAASHPYGLVVTAMVMLLGIVAAITIAMMTLTMFRVAGKQQGPTDNEQARVAACWWHFTVGASVAVWYAVIVLQ